MPAWIANCGWGIFCAVSWTWCIGMWLPILLIHRFGWAGFWLIAIPNVLGCAGMGYVLRSQGASRKAVTQAGLSVTWFSTVTIAYHLFFLSMIATFMTWAFAPDPGLVWLSLWIPIAVFVIAWFVSYLPTILWLVFASIIFAATIVTFLIIGPDNLDHVGDLAEQAPSGAVGAAPMFALGFLLCPHLDATLHRARQAVNGPHAFSIFGIGFAFTMVFVASYAMYAPYALPSLILAFFVYQAIFTIAAHLRELRLGEQFTSRGEVNRGSKRFYMLSPLTVPLIFWLALMVGGTALDEMSLERGYFRFLVMYGLVFPAIMLIWLPNRTKTSLVWLVVILCISLPIAEHGMFWAPTWWLVIPVFLIVGSAVMLNRSNRPRTNPIT